MSVSWMAPADLPRRRRVKCDEGKPACDRCTKLYIRCEGYAPSKPFITAERLASRGLAPLAPRRDLDVSLLPPAVGSSAVARFHSQVDFAYFHSFRQKAVNVLAGPFENMVWKRVVLQACYEEPAIRSLVLSIGALEVCHDSRMGKHGHLPALDSRTHELNALERYGKALYGIQKITQSDSFGAVRTSLIAAMLIYYFENIYSGTDTGNTGIAHFRGALQCLRKELSRHSRRYHHLRTLSPTPDLEDELVATFVRLDCGILLHLDAWGTTPDPQRYILDCDFSESNIPPVFSRLAEARNYLEQVKFWALPGITEIWASEMLDPATPPIIDDSRLELARTLTSNLHRWLDAYEPIFKRASVSRAAGGPFIAEYILQLQALSASIVAEMLWSAEDEADEEEDDTSRRDLVEKANAVVTLSRAIAADPSFYRGFVCECGIIPALFTLMLSGPNLQVRREVLEVLKSVVPRRENVWDSTSLVQLGELSLYPIDDAIGFRT